jgi:hypothetical protein
LATRGTKRETAQPLDTASAAADATVHRPSLSRFNRGLWFFGPDRSIYGNMHIHRPQARRVAQLIAGNPGLPHPAVDELSPTWPPTGAASTR